MSRTASALSVLAGAAAALFIATASFAVGLSEDDIAYLATQEHLRDSPVLQGLSPKELARLHAVINDDRTRSDPVGQARNVAEVWEEFSRNQLWEKQNPGKLWDAKNR